MPETQDTGSPAGPTPEFRKRRRRHRRKPLLVRYWWLAPLAIFLFFIPSIWRWILQPHFQPGPLAGYISEAAKVEDEFRQYTGKPLLGGDALQHFQMASELVLAGSYANAVVELEMVSKQAAVPVIFNDLGVLYVKIHDGEHAVRSFRDALARDHEYAPALSNLKSLKLSVSTDPGSVELEPNNTPRQANVIWLDRPIDGVIDSGARDPDYYWFTAPRPPRDHIAIQIFNKSPTLTPQLMITESGGKGVLGVRQASGPGGDVRVDLSPPPNGSYYLQVAGVGSSSGAYTLSVNSVRAYDVYEPNDDILTPTRISLGQPINANIMDPEDTDYYTFTTSQAGPVTVDVSNSSPTMVLRLTTFAPDRRTTGFAPDTKAGEPVHHVFPVEANQTYYLQVWAKDDTSGIYSLIVKEGEGSAEEKATRAVKQRKKRK